MLSHIRWCCSACSNATSTEIRNLETSAAGIGQSFVDDIATKAYETGFGMQTMLGVHIHKENMDVR